MAELLVLHPQPCGNKDAVVLACRLALHRHGHLLQPGDLPRLLRMLECTDAEQVKRQLAMAILRCLLLAHQLQHAHLVSAFVDEDSFELAVLKATQAHAALDAELPRLQHLRYQGLLRSDAAAYEEAAIAWRRGAADLIQLIQLTLSAATEGGAPSGSLFDEDARQAGAVRAEYERQLQLLVQVTQHRLNALNQ